MAKLIKIAGHLRRLNNFNSLMAFIAGMSASAVWRLKWTKLELPRSATQQLAVLDSWEETQSTIERNERERDERDENCEKIKE